MPPCAWRYSVNRRRVSTDGRARPSWLGSLVRSSPSLRCSKRRHRRERGRQARPKPSSKSRALRRVRLARPNAGSTPSLVTSRMPERRARSSPSCLISPMTTCCESPPMSWPRPRRWHGGLEAVGNHVGIDMAEFWQPDDAFFDLVRGKAVTNAMLAEVAGKAVADQNLSPEGRDAEEDHPGQPGRHQWP